MKRTNFLNTRDLHGHQHSFPTRRSSDLHTIDTANRVLVVIKAEICAEEYSPLNFASSNYFDCKFSCEATTSFFTFKFIDDSTEPPGGVMSEQLFILLCFFY